MRISMMSEVCATYWRGRSSVIAIPIAATSAATARVSHLRAHRMRRYCFSVMAKPSEERLFHVDHVVPLDEIVHLHLGDMHHAVAVAAVHADAALGAPRREAAGLRKRLQERHAALDAHDAGPLDLAVDVGLRRTVDIDDVAVLD